MDMRRLITIRDPVLVEGGAPLAYPVNRVAVCDIVRSGFARVNAEDLALLHS